MESYLSRYLDFWGVDRLFPSLDNGPNPKAACVEYPSQHGNVNFPIRRQTARQRGGAVRSVSTTSKLISLTFDICEAAHDVAGFDPNLVMFLIQEKIPATFFLCGKWLKHHTLLSQQLISCPLFEIGNHSWDHANFSTCSQDEALRQIVYTQECYQSIYDKLNDILPYNLKEIGAKRVIELFRFPYGSVNKVNLKTVESLNLVPIQWSIESRDSDPTVSAEKIVEHVDNKIHEGAIVLLHANGRGPYNRKALSMLVPRLSSRGYSFVNVSDLLDSGEPLVDDKMYFETPGDTESYKKFGIRPMRCKCNLGNVSIARVFYE